MRKPSTPVRARPALPPRVPTLAELAELLGIELVRNAHRLNLAKLRRGPPAYVGVLDLCIERMQRPQDAALLVGVATAAQLEGLSREQKHLAALEAVASSLHRSLQVQRAVVDDRAIGVMRAVRRVVRAQGSPDLERRWSFLMEYLGAVSGGAGTHRKPKAKRARAPEPPGE